MTFPRLTIQSMAFAVLLLAADFAVLRFIFTVRNPDRYAFMLLVVLPL
jgi:hypothetical protein